MIECDKDRNRPSRPPCRGSRWRFRAARCIVPSMRAVSEQPDFSVVVKNRASPPKPWRWEIYRAGRNSPIEHSEVFFESVAEATRAGKVALQSLLSDYPG